MRGLPRKVRAALENPKVMRVGREVDKFTTGTHTFCWKRYKVRPSASSPNPYETDSRYCVYDRLHKDYGYTEAWVDFLVEKVTNEKEFASMCKMVEQTASDTPQ